MKPLLRLFSPPPLPAPASAGLLILRLVAGTAFVIHGWGKIQNPFGWMGPDASIPGFFQALAAISEFGGGIAWTLGALTPPASFGLACTMAVAVYMHVAVYGGSFEPAAVYLAVAILLMLAGPGRWSVDRLLFGERG